MLVVALSMPISILTTFLFMLWMDYSINIVTLLGIGLGTGMIVDASIVVIENIFRKAEEGLLRRQAVTEGTKEVIAPVTSSVLTTLAVFVPVAFIDGIIGQYLKELALTVSVSLVTSLLVAFTVIPLLSNRMLGAAKPSGMMERVQSAYGKALTYVLKRKWRTLFAFTLLLGASLYALLAYVPKGFFPNITDRSLFIEYELDEKVAFETNKQLMAGAVIFGLTFSTLVTLFIVPVLYVIFARTWFRGKMFGIFQFRRRPLPGRTEPVSSETHP